MRLTRRNFVEVAASGGLGALLCGAATAETVPAEEAAASPKTGLRIAVVQQESVPGAVGPNREKALMFAKEALRNKPDLILFHEALLTGYIENIRELAEEKTGPTTQAFQEVLRGTDTLVLYGLVEREGGDYYTAATLVNSGGVVANYRKTHLWWKAEGVRHEPAFFRPGNELVTFDVKGWKCGVMICYDGDFPEMTRAYANRECVVLFWLNNRNSRGKEEVLRLARTNSMIMATACCCGKNDTKEIYRGGSNIINFDGAVLGEIWDKEGVIFAEVDPAGVMGAREQNPAFRGQRQELYR
jgi:predicted amidohydrolase